MRIVHWALCAVHLAHCTLCTPYTAALFVMASSVLITMIQQSSAQGTVLFYADDLLLPTPSSRPPSCHLCKESSKLFMPMGR